jgi:hypothetical protein
MPSFAAVTAPLAIFCVVTAPSAIFGVVTAPLTMSAVFTVSANPCTGSEQIAATANHFATLLPISLLILFLHVGIMRLSGRTSH